MQDRLFGAALTRVTVWALAALLIGVGMTRAAPYAAVVIDARTGEVLHSRNADTRLHPASLTKMMTLYIAFEAVRNGEITLDTKVKISRFAAAEPPSKLGLRSGQRIAFRYLIRAAAVKSANDAATAIGEAISGSEAAFARRMTRTAKAMGMTRTTFKNAHGLTESGHLSTARDMTTLGRHLLYDYPQYYNLFSRRSTSAGIKTVNNTNRRLLGAYRGADGIKTGYTRAAGFNLVASAQRGDERIIATMFGGSSSAARNARVAELLNMGFNRAPSRATLRKPQRPAYAGNFGGTTLRVSGAVTRSLIPRLRAPSTQPGQSDADGSTAIVQLAAMDSPALIPSTSEIDAAVAQALAAPATPAVSTKATVTQAALAPAIAATPAVATVSTAGIVAPKPTLAANGSLVAAVLPAAAPIATTALLPDPGPKALPNGAILRPVLRPSSRLAATQPVSLTPDATVVRPAITAPARQSAPQPEPTIVVTRAANTGSTDWSINVGRYTNQFEAEKALLRVALTESATLAGAIRKVANTSKGFEARFHGLTRENAEMACRRLSVQQYECQSVGPS